MLLILFAVSLSVFSCNILGLQSFSAAAVLFAPLKWHIPTQPMSTTSSTGCSGYFRSDMFGEHFRYATTGSAS